VGRPEAPLAAAAAARWSELAEAFRAASEPELPELPEAARWEAIGAAAERVLEAERGLWSALGHSS
jgi:hypothetical protein